MIATTHAIVGALIARHIPDTYVASVVAFGSHYVLDSIPHWDFGTDWQSRSKKVTGLIAISDTLIGITIATLVFGTTVELYHLLIVVACAELPDWLEAPWYILYANNDREIPQKHDPLLKKILFRMYQLQSGFHARTSFPFGAFTQVATIIFFSILLWK